MLSGGLSFEPPFTGEPAGGGQRLSSKRALSIRGTPVPSSTGTIPRNGTTPGAVVSVRLKSSTGAPGKVPSVTTGNRSSAKSVTRPKQPYSLASYFDISSYIRLRYTVIDQISSRSESVQATKSGCRSCGLPFNSGKNCRSECQNW
jgi:hypothetical protein